MMNLIGLAELGIVPDFLIRGGIRRLLANRLHDVQESGLREFACLLRNSPLAVETATANEQHYEVPTEFFQAVLGARLKYSCCLFEDDVGTLDKAEEAMLRMTCKRAEIEDGMRVLELGCGWGSLSLWMAEHYPNCQIMAVSNSGSQRRFIENQAKRLNLENLRVITADMRDFATKEEFDRVVSVEMFEHMRNYELLFERVSQWLTPTGKAFVHVFCHRTSPYLFESEGASNWMGRHFFSGGTMPSEDLFAQFNNHLHIEQQWRVSGLHYWKTCEAWLQNADCNRGRIVRRFQQDLTRFEAKVRFQRWRIFFMACAELFRYNRGNEWFVAHFLFRPVASSRDVSFQLATSMDWPSK